MAYNYKYKIEDYKRFVKEKALDINEEKNLVLNEFVDTFNLVSSRFRKINSGLLSSKYLMYKWIFDALYSLKPEIEYLYFTGTRLKSIHSNSNTEVTPDQYLSECRKDFYMLLDSLPAPDKTLKKSQIDRIIHCHKDMYYAISFDIDNHTEVLFLESVES